MTGDSQMRRAWEWAGRKGLWCLQAPRLHKQVPRALVGQAHPFVQARSCNGVQKVANQAESMQLPKHLGGRQRSAVGRGKGREGRVMSLGGNR